MCRQSNVKCEEIEHRRDRQREKRRPKHTGKKKGGREGVKILDANSVFFYSLVCLHERQRSEMQKCHLASIRLPLSSPLRSERRGEGLLKRVFKRAASLPLPLKSSHHSFLSALNM